jgi:tetratricopeptide (TPR) repeat protein
MPRPAPHRRKAPLAVLILLGVGVATAPAKAAEAAGADPFEAMTRAVAEAEQSLAAGETQIAESRYRTALFEGWLLLGRLREETGDLQPARGAYEAAAASAVETRRARIALALVLARLDDSDQAELVLRSLIADDTTDSEARRLLASTLAEAGRLDDAVQELEQLRYLTPDDPENAYLLATAYLRQGSVDKADELLSEIAATVPTPQTQILIGRTYRDADLHERARRAFRAALALDPDVRRAHYYLGTVHLLERGETALEDAISEFESELAANPGEETTSLYLGMALVEERRFDEAIRHLETASHKPDLRADALRFLGRGLLETGRTEEAVAVSRRGLEAAEATPAPTPGSATEFHQRQISSLHYQLAQALRRLGENEEANVHFAAAKKYQARSAESARESLDRYLADETTSGALETRSSRGADEVARGERAAELEDAVQSSLARAYLNLGVLAARAKSSRRAAELFAQAAELDPELPDLQYSLGVALFDSGQFAQATGPLSRALEQRAGDDRLRQMLALAWLDSDEPAKAAELLGRIGNRAASPGLQYAYGLALVRSGRPDEAAAIFLELLRDNGEWPQLNVVLGQAFAAQGDFERATESLRRALALDAAVAEAHSTLGEIHLRRGELEEAEGELRSEVATHPEDKRAAYTLATVLDLARKPEEAIAVLRSILAAEPQLAKGRYLLGKILLAGGALEEAREQLEAAAGLSPTDPNTHYQLGQAYQKLGRTAEAREEFETFRRLKDERRGGEGR